MRATKQPIFYNKFFCFYNLFLWAIGGGLYAFIEILWRGRTHPSMFLLGGICFCFLSFLQRTQLFIPLKMLYGALGITALEYLFGVIFNLWLKQNVWDYTYRPYSFHGQICLRYSLYWLALTVPAFALSSLFDRFIWYPFQKKHPSIAQKA